MPCNNIISDNDILSAYKVNNICDNNNIVASYCVGNNFKTVKIDMHDKQNQSILKRNIERSYHLSQPLFKEKNKLGKIAEHKYFILKDEYRRRSIGGTIHSNELNLYKQLKFNEIQLRAAWDGLIVWEKLGFKYKDNIDKKKVEAFIKIYLDSLGKTIEEIEDILNEGMPKELFLDFEQWSNKQRYAPVINMYKEVS